MSHHLMMKPSGNGIFGPGHRRSRTPNSGHCGSSIPWDSLVIITLGSRDGRPVTDSGAKMGESASTLTLTLSNGWNSAALRTSDEDEGRGGEGGGGRRRRRQGQRGRARLTTGGPHRLDICAVLRRPQQRHGLSNDACACRRFPIIVSTFGRIARRTAITLTGTDLSFVFVW